MDIIEKEYDGLHREVNKLAAEARKMELVMPLASAAVVSWMSTDNRHWDISTLMLLPLIPLVGGILAYRLYLRVLRIGSYLRLIERSPSADYGASKLVGWQHYIEKDDALVRISRIYWIVYFLLSVGAACYFGFLKP